AGRHAGRADLGVGGGGRRHRGRRRLRGEPQRVPPSRHRRHGGSGAMTGPTRARIPLYGWLTAEAISLLGTRVSMIAIPWLVLTTTGSATKDGIGDVHGSHH